MISADTVKQRKNPCMIAVLYFWGRCALRYVALFIDQAIELDEPCSRRYETGIMWCQRDVKSQITHSLIHFPHSFSKFQGITFVWTITGKLYKLSAWKRIITAERVLSSKLYFRKIWKYTESYLNWPWSTDTNVPCADIFITPKPKFLSVSP